MTPEPLTTSEQEFLGQVCGFAERRAQNGCYLLKMHSKSLDAPVLLFFAIGKQAEFVHNLLMEKGRQEQPAIEVVSSLDVLTDTTQW